MGRFMPGVWQQAGLGLAEQGPSPACPSHLAPVLWAPEIQGIGTSSQECRSAAVAAQMLCCILCSHG